MMYVYIYKLNMINHWILKFMALIGAIYSDKIKTKYPEAARLSNCKGINGIVPTAKP